MLLLFPVDTTLHFVTGHYPYQRTEISKELITTTLLIKLNFKQKLLLITIIISRFARRAFFGSEGSTGKKLGCRLKKITHIVRCDKDTTNKTPGYIK
jgi:hypothetical protein